MPADKPKPKYLHLRRWNLNTRQFERTGGITLAYVKEGHWYKVGAAFCSLKDTYQESGKDIRGKTVGRDLARERLWTAPCWIHEEDWGLWTNVASRLTTSWGRAWFDTALRRGVAWDWSLLPKTKVEKAKLEGPCTGRSYTGVTLDDIIATEGYDQIITDLFSKPVDSEIGPEPYRYNPNA